MALNASITRQFEFVQQQWITYGNDAHLGNDKDLLMGNHCTDGESTSSRATPPPPTRPSSAPTCPTSSSSAAANTSSSPASPPSE